MRTKIKSRFRRICRMASVGLVWLAVTTVAFAAEQSVSVELRLPTVSGQFGVGTAIWHWAEDIQQDGNDDLQSRYRELMAQLWYPTDSSSEPNARYRPLGGKAFEHILQNSVAAAPFAGSLQKAPVIVLCPGRGTNRYYYTSIAEDLASHGFAVLAIDMPGIGYVEFPDGRTIEPSNVYRPSFELITGPYEKVDEFFEPAVTIGLTYLKLALDRLTALNSMDANGGIAGRLDLEVMGAFGHSLGGRICGGLAGTDERFAALATMEGVPPLDARQSGMSAASLMLYSSELPEEMALPNIRELYDNRKAEATIIRLEGFGHNSVTDRPLIFPDNFDYDVDPGRALEVTRTILSAFFQAHLASGEFDPDRLGEMSEVTVIESSAP